jgi:hypothetical protein
MFPARLPHVRILAFAASKKVGTTDEASGKVELIADSD